MSDYQDKPRAKPIKQRGAWALAHAGEQGASTGERTPQR
jgi:hypothetical protein